MVSLQENWTLDVRLLVSEKEKESPTQKTPVGLINSTKSEMAVEKLVLLPVETHVMPKPLEKFQVVCLRVLSLKAVCHLYE